MHRTQFTDGQLAFGPNTNINTDDIPQGTAHLWLTPSAQVISGSKVFTETLGSRQDFIVNYDYPSTDAQVEFRCLDFSGNRAEHLRWNYSNARFEFTDNVNIIGALTTAASGSTMNTLTTVGDLTVGGDAFVDGQVYVRGVALYFNADGPDDAAGLYFYDGGSPTGKFFAWVDDVDRFVLQGSLRIRGSAATAESGSIMNTLTTVDNLTVGGQLGTFSPLRVIGNTGLIVDPGQFAFVASNFPSAGLEFNSGGYFDFTDVDGNTIFKSYVAGPLKGITSTKAFRNTASGSTFTGGSTHLGNVQTTDDFIAINSNGDGMIVRDASTGSLYRIRVNNGSVEAEVV